MKRQSSEGPATASTRSHQNNHSRHHSGNITPSRSNDPQQIPGVKKIISFSRNPNRNGPIKIISRELSPGSFSVPKTEPCEPVYQSFRSPANELEKEHRNKAQTGAKGQRSALSLRNVSDQQFSEMLAKKPLSALDVKDLKALKMKKTASLNINVDIANKTKTSGAKSATNPGGQFQFFEKNKTEISEAIFERDEADEEDNKDHFKYNQTPELKVVSADQTVIINRENVRLKSREQTESPLMTRMENNSGIYSFKLENPLMSDPISPGLKIDFEGNTGSTKPSAFNRGTFMNEHITQSEFEKQKEKKRLMKEALDLQLNEKKRKQEEAKLRERELSVKEEQRIHREMTLMNERYEKETAFEGLKKTNFKTEETENLLTNQSGWKLNSPPKQIEKPEKHSSGSDKIDTRDTSINSSNLFHASQTREDEKILKSPVKMQRTTSNPLQNNKEVTESPLKFTHSDVDLLTDENKKLRDENTKKAELIDALISVLKHKDTGNFQGIHDRNNSYSQSRREESISYPSSKLLKPLDIGEQEVESLGYTFGGYNQPKGKYRIASEQPSEANRYDPRESNRHLNEERNFSMSIFDRMEAREYQPKVIRPVMPDVLMEFTNNAQSRDNTAPYKPGNGSGLRNNEISALFGASSNRVYSSPLANHLNYSSIVSPVHKPESRNSPYLSFLGPNPNYPSFGPLTLEPIKSLSLSSATSPKGGYVPTNQLVSPSNSTVIRIKKRQEHSVDIAELNREQELRSASYRPAFMNEDGSFSLIKPSRAQKKNMNNQTYSSYNYGSQPQKIEIIDTYQHPGEDRNTSATLETIHETESNPNYQSKMLGKVIPVFTGVGNKKMSGGIGKEKWVIAETTSPSKKMNKEELIEKIKALPTLEGKPKFPKDVFTLNIRKKVCP